MQIENALLEEIQILFTSFSHIVLNSLGRKKRKKKERGKGGKLPPKAIIVCAHTAFNFSLKSYTSVSPVSAGLIFWNEPFNHYFQKLFVVHLVWSLSICKAE